jgi:biotin-dependent carboxylase-like uncharacterized protein
MGVTRSGAFDRRALEQGNSLLGNRAAAAGIEVLGGGLSMLAADNHVLALTGAPASATIDGEPAAHGRVLSVRRGQSVHLGALALGMRTYVTVGGGFTAPSFLDSVSTDTLSGLGPRALRPGDRLSVGLDHGPTSDIDVPALIGYGDVSIGVSLGPRDDWFTADGLRTLVTCPWTVGAASDRVGLRLEGRPIERSDRGELPSEPCVRGSIQVTAEGFPIVLGPDHPVTGGYPVIAVVLDRDVDALAQARPGQVIRFTAVPLP